MKVAMAPARSNLKPIQAKNRPGISREISPGADVNCDPRFLIRLNAFNFQFQLRLGSFVIELNDRRDI